PASPSQRFWGGFQPDSQENPRFSAYFTEYGPKSKNGAKRRENDHPLIAGGSTFLYGPRDFHPRP
ncbi:MAG: hypothetical protein ACPHGY_03840, partial [Rhodospirillaceae bacterium]